jgi:hypothetical protein
VRRVDPPADEIPIPDYLMPLVERQPAQTASYLKHKSNPVRGAPAIFRGYELKDWTEWWPVYFYRFVSPEARMGENLNYADRAQSATVTILPVGWRVYEMPGATADAGQPSSRSADASENPLVGE